MGSCQGTNNSVFIYGECVFVIYVSLLQRGSDELLSQSAVSVMAPATPHHADNNNQENAKKVSITRY